MKLMKILNKIKKEWSTYIIYISLTYLVYYLLNSGILFFPEINNLYYLILSLLFLLIGFYFDMFSWKYILRINSIYVNNKNIVISNGSAILGKYIPGKIWTVMGRAKIISDDCKISLFITSAISFEAQILILWTGLVISMFGAMIVGLDIYYLILILSTLIIFSLIIFTDKYKILFEKYTFIIFKKNIIFKKAKYNYKTLLIFFIPWVSWSIGFYLLSSSIITKGLLNTEVLFALPFSVTFGILAIFSPGGIGIREGIITIFLTTCGMSISEATTISVFSRLWFLFGELVMFFIAYFTKIFSYHRKGN